MVEHFLFSVQIYVIHFVAHMNIDKRKVKFLIHNIHTTLKVHVSFTFDHQKVSSVFFVFHLVADVVIQFCHINDTRITGTFDFFCN